MKNIYNNIYTNQILHKEEDFLHKEVDILNYVPLEVDSQDFVEENL